MATTLTITESSTSLTVSDPTISLTWVDGTPGPTGATGATGPEGEATAAQGALADSALQREIDGNIIHNVDSGEGQKIGTTAANNFGWRDLEGPIIVRGIGGSSPSWAEVGSTGFRKYQFSIGDECWISFHVPHDYVPGTDIYIHAHWFSDGTQTNTVKWEWNLAYADGYGAGAFPLESATTVTAEEAATGVAYTHELTETTAITISGIEVDGMIECHIERITNGATENTDGIFLITSDIHYQSTNLPTKNRNPNFYGA